MSENPYFSVIIPTHNRPESLSVCLLSLCKLDYPTDRWEVIVVDDGSTVALSAVFKRVEHLLPLKALRQQVSRGPAAARNLGAQNARGHYLVFLDDDCFVDPQWLKNYEACLSKQKKEALVGVSLNPNPDVIGARVWSLLVTFLYEYWQNVSGNILIAITNNYVVAREAFFAAGAFDTAFPLAASEDREFSWRFVAHGFRIGFSPDAQVWHSQPNLGVSRYLKLQFRYGYYANLFQKKRDPKTVNALSKQFGSESRLRYAIHLFRFARNRNVGLIDTVVLFSGHIAHFLGRKYHSLSNRASQ
nr:glycosyltransferase [Anaerolineae bacterium]